MSTWATLAWAILGMAAVLAAMLGLTWWLDRRQERHAARWRGDEDEE